MKFRINTIAGEILEWTGLAIAKCTNMTGIRKIVIDLGSRPSLMRMEADDMAITSLKQQFHQPAFLSRTEHFNLLSYLYGTFQISNKAYSRMSHVDRHCAYVEIHVKRHYEMI